MFELTGLCACGALVRRPRAEGRLSHVINNRPFVCAACERREEQAIDEDNRRNAFERAWRDAGLPPALAACDLSALDHRGIEIALLSARRWADGQLPGLLLTGEVGVGKTTIAAGALLAALPRTLDVRWVSAPSLAKITDPPRLSRASLVLDDLDKVRGTEFGAERVFDAIDGAITRSRQLLVTTNLRPSLLAESWPAPYGEAIVSRLVGYCRVEEITGADRRLGSAVAYGEGVSG